jgi:hypothetical protein
VKPSDSKNRGKHAITAQNKGSIAIDHFCYRWNKVHFSTLINYQLSLIYHLTYDVGSRKTGLCGATETSEPSSGENLMVSKIYGKWNSVFCWKVENRTWANWTFSTTSSGFLEL